MKKLSLKPITSYLKKSKMELSVIASVLFFDLLSKYLISHFIDLYDSVTIIKKFLYLYYTKNEAAAFSFDFGLTPIIGVEGVRIFFICLMSVVVVGFIITMVAGSKNHVLYRLSFAMIIGGALGNLYDRIFHHAVRDFIRFEYLGHEIFGSEYFAIFNIADSSLVIGVGVFIFYVLFIFPKEEAERLAKQSANSDPQPQTQNEINPTSEVQISEGQISEGQMSERKMSEGEMSKGEING